jgi:hypothetical protein
MAYSLGEDIPLILQGATQREGLSSGMAGISPVLLYTGIGLLAYVLIFGGKSRMNW